MITHKTPSRLKVLVACEESQAVTMELRRLGHEAYSCDLLECSGGHPEWHIQGDCLPLINGHDEWKAPFPIFRTCDGCWHDLPKRWDMILAFPPCTYLTNASAVRMRVKGEIVKERYEKAMEAKDFFLRFLNADCAKIAVENPTPMKLVGLPPYTQAIQPWQFGHPFTKRTCLWLKGLPLLQPTKIITDGITPYVNGGCKDVHGNYRRFQGRKERDPKIRAKTFPGIAKAMAEQWAGQIQQRSVNSMTKFCDRLRAAMSEAKLTQAALAGMVDVSKASMSGYLSGKVNPPEKKKEQIALALGKPHNFFQVEEVNLEIAADGGYRLKPALAAKLMGVSERTLKHGLQNGDFPWGYAILNPETGTHTYWISRIRFSAETGIPVPLT